MDVLPELTRTEYIRLLQAAKALERERVYFLLKALCGIGIRVGELEQFTVELLQKGSGVMESKGTKRLVVVPNAIKQEFGDYIRRNGIYSGPIFTTSGGRPVNRVNIFKEIKSVCETARVEEKKVTHRCLWKLHRTTFHTIEKNISALVWMAYEQTLTEEQMQAGWEIE